MPFLFDFGVSQEDFRTEESVLKIADGDIVLSLASAGEVPLSILSNCKVKITAVDISEKQIFLCKLKLACVLFIDFPQNGQFLGFGKIDKKSRAKIYFDIIRPHLSSEEIIFWDRNLKFIKNGVINAGRFEHYMNQLRFLVFMIIGRKNIFNLIKSKNLKEQTEIFDKKIASRKSLQWLFKVAFHPKIYKNRGLSEQALIHANKTTGERFYLKFRNLCTTTLSSENYFLQYFLIGYCLNNNAFPQYLKPEYKEQIINNLSDFEICNISLQTELSEKEKGFYTKIHLSNLGDWLTETDFEALIQLLKNKCVAGTRICYRYLQKNHFATNKFSGFEIDEKLSEAAYLKDRFPFYNIISLTMSD